MFALAPGLAGSPQPGQLYALSPLHTAQRQGLCWLCPGGPSLTLGACTSVCPQVPTLRFHRQTVFSSVSLARLGASPPGLGSVRF